MNVFITCTSEKASHRCKAKDMYTSALFKKCWEYAQTLNPDKIYILSAKHHLLNPNTEINPYNAYLGDFSEEEKKEEAPKAPTTKKCPFCCSEIAIEATRCPHCTSLLGDEQPRL